MKKRVPAKVQREVLMTLLAIGALLETAWIIYLATSLPRHYVANHWNVAWVGLDVAQVALLLLAAWAAWQKRAVLVLFANACATLLLLDAWFDLTTARYKDLSQSIIALSIELPSAFFLLWVSRRTARRLTSSWLAESDLALVPGLRLPIPNAVAKQIAAKSTTP